MSNVEQIAKLVEADRARLASTLDRLTDTVNPRRVSQEMSTTAASIGSELANKAWKSLREQPAGGILVTIGLGLLAAGSQRQSAPTPPSDPDTTAVDPKTAMEGFDAPVAAADASIRQDMSGRMAPSPDASKLRSALNSGLDQLSPQARSRVAKARKAAIAAQEKVEAQAQKAVRESKGFVREQPLVAGALAIGFGTLLGTLLPGTRREDALLGARRDALMAEARLALESELEKAKLKAETALQPNGGSAADPARI